MYKITISNKMSTFKDITYKKQDDETWSEWSKRVPDNDEDKLDYIGETIYAKIHENDKEKAGKITGMLLQIDLEELIYILNNELLDEKIKDAYEVLREDEEIKMSDEEVLSSEVEYLEAIRENREQMCIDMEKHQVAWTSEIVPCVFCSKDTAKVKRKCGFDICNDCFEVNKTSDGGCLLPLSHQVCWPRGEGCEEPELVDDEEDKCEQCGKTEEDCITEGMLFDTCCLSIYAVDNRLLCPDCIPSFDNDDDSNVTVPEKPVTTLTVAEMIAALSKLPPDAKLVMTESGFYSRSDFAEVMLPKLYTVQNDEFQCDLPTGTEVYIIGHSHQSYL